MGLDSNAVPIVLFLKFYSRCRDWDGGGGGVRIKPNRKKRLKNKKRKKANA